jgi:hypothetical protein
MNLDETQKRTVATWIDQGLKLAEIQKRLIAELGLTLTYMEVRQLVGDLNLVPKDPPPPPVPVEKEIAKAAPAAPGLPAAAQPPLAPAPGASRVTLTVDQVTRPGCLASGQVTFSDGQLGDWYMDQMGRLGVAPKVKSYRPSPADVQAFQQALEGQLSRLGL